MAGAPAPPLPPTWIPLLFPADAAKVLAWKAPSLSSHCRLAREDGEKEASKDALVLYAFCLLRALSFTLLLLLLLFSLLLHPRLTQQPAHGTTILTRPVVHTRTRTRLLLYAPPTRP
ncbi:hypothetical protein CDD82_7307 [Ophiocordyceps australis]|uniref:Uncharacterized protein n=1 Tax=Ophiocordyceps australis TaxID=1399860 RepID=A0A2C5XW91_9HYPO|nr:hypothetical protein CDD82_7307 [Ophiocordyceps australis]